MPIADALHHGITTVFATTDQGHHLHLAALTCNNNSANVSTLYNDEPDKSSQYTYT